MTLVDSRRWAHDGTSRQAQWLSLCSEMSGSPRPVSGRTSKTKAPPTPRPSGARLSRRLRQGRATPAPASRPTPDPPVPQGNPAEARSRSSPRRHCAPPHFGPRLRSATLRRGFWADGRPLIPSRPPPPRSRSHGAPGSRRKAGGLALVISRTLVPPTSGQGSPTPPACRQGMAPPGPRRAALRFGAYGASQPEEPAVTPLAHPPLRACAQRTRFGSGKGPASRRGRLRCLWLAGRGCVVHPRTS